MSRRQRALRLRTLLLPLLPQRHFPLSISSSAPKPQTNPTITSPKPKPETKTLKPWPILPSFLPWTNPNPNPPPKSCEAYFDNGFSHQIQVFGLESGPEKNHGFFRCLYSETLASSIWEMGRVRMDPGRIWMSEGGEALETVIGRSEEEELPRFEDGAFLIEGDVKEIAGGKGRKAVDEGFLDKYSPVSRVQDHTMRALMNSIRVVEPGKLECSQIPRLSIEQHRMKSTNMKNMDYDKNQLSVLLEEKARNCNIVQFIDRVYNS